MSLFMEALNRIISGTKEKKVPFYLNFFFVKENCGDNPGNVIFMAGNFICCQTKGSVTLCGS